MNLPTATEIREASQRTDKYLSEGYSGICWLWLRDKAKYELFVFVDGKKVVLS